MITATFIVRILLGLILTIFPINALFIKAFKPKMPEKAQIIMNTFSQTGYLLTFIQATELIIGITLLTGYFTPLAVLALLPISINILLFHIYLAPPIVGPGLFIFLMNIFLIYSYRAEYIHLLNP
ncbi:DoxX family membrane protein [Capnocytophaga canimorsus]|uniref:DoxX family membrane protein n=1 Tax=Capnocytophaga canimorsus TaxID=28188 RepID=UPI000D6E61DC|nr:DoxX family membrane protein [Capnocytophaga canimorsus]AWL79405.1 DoxX protein [Capnocytophaga canimorsus]AYW35982.1 DoxX family membrane protein [Capnocytophaga canimorsus]